MKKSYFGLLLAALVTLGSCTKENTVNPDPVVDPAAQGDLFMTMNIAMRSQTGTRTSTPNQGYEVGQSEENKISKALIILAKEVEPQTDGKKYEIVFTSETGTNLQNNVGDTGHNGTVDNDPDEDGDFLAPDPAHQSQYKARFTFDRQALLAELDEDATSGEPGAGTDGKKKDFIIFMVANPTPSISRAAKEGEDIQSVIEAASNPATYSGGAQAPNTEIFWQDNYFVMSSAYAVKKTIYSEEIKEGTHITKEDAYPLGTVTVQRVMSRFDLAVGGNHLNFQGSGNNQSGSDGLGQGLAQVKVEFDAVAMVNMAKKAYLYKVMADKAANLNYWNNGAGTVTKFGDERDADYATWWTFTPAQDAYFSPLFDGIDDFSAGNLKGEAKDTKANNLKSFFATNADYQLISSITKEDNAFDFKKTESDQGEGPHVAGTGDYRIWRYAMENTNPDNADNQLNGNSTGIVFRAKLTEVYPTEQDEMEKYGARRIPTEYLPTDRDKKGQKIYAYNNVILGTAEQLFAYATSSKKDTNDPVYDDVNTIYWRIIEAKYQENKSETENTEKGGWKSVDDDAWWIEVKDETTGPAPEGGSAGGVKTTIYHHGDLELEGDEEIMAKLVDNGFTIYEPTTKDASGQDLTAPVYYCYYIYWNRHNDNGQNTIMGDMEFATVRNNVYKLSVNAVKRLGHPGETDNDPYPPTPGTPDEEDEFWLEVQCNILPWEVRINNIEF